MRARIAVAGAGIYGATAAIRLAEQGHTVHLFDPLGVLRAASGINQYRVHAGYHYPRSPETIREVQEARSEFLETFAPAIVRNSQHYYAIPREGSRTSSQVFEQVMARNNLPLRSCRPDWMNFEFIEQCYEVKEHIYDPDLLRSLIESRMKKAGVEFRNCSFSSKMRSEYDFVVWATYGIGPSKGLFKAAKFQVAEKILIQLPEALRGVSLVVVDGPFTAFDPYGSSAQSLFGSAKNTNHWSSTNLDDPIPEPYTGILNQREFAPVPFTRFEAMRSDCCLTVPQARDAVYLGSRFTIRVIEDNPDQDRRILYIREGEPREFHIFSGKVVSAVKAARMICERIANYA